jgi:hypothetical protein
MRTTKETDVLIKSTIEKAKQNGYYAPYCLISKTEINISKFPEITKVQIDPGISEDYIFIYPCNAEITRSNQGFYEVTYIPETQKNTDKSTDHLKDFIRNMNTILDSMSTIIMNVKINQGIIQKLHNKILSEFKKESIDMVAIKLLIKEMEDLAAKNNQLDK